MKTRLNKTQNFRSLLTLVAAVAVIFSIQSCDLHEISYPEEEQGYVSYSASIQPIFNSDCTGCHSSGTPNLSEGASYTSLTENGYIDTDNPEESLLYTTLTGSPHSAYTSSKNRAMILEWIEAGAPND